MASKTFATLVLCAGLCVGNIAAADAQPSVQMRFVMAHRPFNTENVALIQNFADRVKERTKGAVEITPVKTYAVLRKDEPALQGDADVFTASKIYSGEAEMGQMSAKVFNAYSNAITVLDTPMLFTSHEHVTKVLDGPVGEKLRESVLAGSNGRLRGLSFTYSGGFRNFYSSLPLKSLADLKGRTMRIPTGVMSRDLVDQLGLDMIFHPVHTQQWQEAFLNNRLQVEEAETIRLERYTHQFPGIMPHVKTVFKTNHNLYLTMVTINGKIFDSLTPEQQHIIQEEAQDLAVKERLLSIRQEEEAEKKFAAMGVRFVTLSKEDRALLESASLKVQAMHRSDLGSWMEAIRAEDTKHYAKQKPEQVSLKVAQ